MTLKVKKSALMMMCALTASFSMQSIAADVKAEPVQAVSVFESKVYGDLFGTPAIRSVFSDTAMVQQWIEVEMALANAQAEVGIIPQSAAAEITMTGKSLQIDYAKLKKGTNKVGRGIKPMLKQFKKAGGKVVSSYLHFGSTTQDIMDTSTALQVKQGSEIIRSEMVQLVNQLALLADKHKETVMIARSNGQDAVPTTFGLHLTTYLMEMARNIDRLDEASSRLTAQIGSTVGTLAPYGDKGPALQKAFAKKLGMNAPIAPWNPSRDVFAEMVQTLAMVDATLGRLALDINNLGRTQINEVKEGESGASSTMPQKRNPRASEFMGGFSRMGKMYNSASLDIMSHTDTRQGSPWILEWSIIPESFMVTSASLERAQRMFGKLIVNEQVMLDNFAAADYFSMSEALMNKLTEKVGRSDAYSMVKKAIKAAAPEDTLRDVATNSKEIKKHLSDKEIDAVLKPQNYIGSSAKIVERSVKHIQATYK
ncbi:class-II fumarase/aspartase family protein [Vibrio sp. SCSIO 43137]|uniref:class-II fumarase/aspartase family protein n=1 Tax=Vibrio sp. SCSIO 43137 TaxID=3021011 RepID=UPI002307E87C|nr:adenylosuccinate lyase family protein [Vibrio sp. SCSIO 43137]WCE31398.1 adenylosuccinate lyase family protein [Vibrio sp. SCSIO 43137]